MADNTEHTDQANSSPGPASRSAIKRRRVWPWVTLAVLIFLIAGTRFALKSDWLMNMIRVQIEKQAGQNLNGSLRIGSMEGDLLNEIWLRDIALRDMNNDLVASIDSVYLRFETRPLFRRAVVVNEISLWNPDLFIREIRGTDDAITWNILQLLKDTPKETDPEKEADPAFELYLEDVQITGGHIAVWSPSYLPDTAISVSDLRIGTEISLDKSGLSTVLHQLRFSLHEGRLDSPVEVDMAAGMEGGLITLEKLTMATGTSLMQAWGRYNEDGSDLALDLLLDPMSYRDVVAMMEEPYWVQDVKIRLSLSGSLQGAEVELGVEAQGLERVSLRLGGFLQPYPGLTLVELRTGALDLPLFTGNPGLPEVGSLRFGLEGEIPADKPENGRFQSDLRLDGIRYEGYTLDRLIVRARLEDQSLGSEVQIGHGTQRVDAQMQAARIFDAEPKWNLSVRSSGMNPAIWLNEPAWDARLNIDAQFAGSGFEPGTSPWSVNVSISESRWRDQEFSLLGLRGTLSESVANVTGQVRVDQSEISLKAGVIRWKTDDPGYDFSLETQAFDVSELSGLENFPTSINLSASGRGRGVDPETMMVTAELELLESLLNNALVEELRADLRMEDGVVYFSDTYLRSALAEGRLDVRQNLFDFDDLQNRVDFDMEFRDVSALAPLFDADTLQFTGTASGRYRTSRTAASSVEAMLSLQDIVIDSLTVARTDGRATVHFREHPHYELDVRVGGFGMGTYMLDDFWLRTSGEWIDSAAVGRYRMDVSYVEDTGLSTQGNYFLSPDSVVVQTVDLNLFDPDNRYYLSDPFRVFYVFDRLEIEPLLLMGTSDVEIRFEAVQYDREAFRGRFSAINVDLAILQRIIMNESHFDGIMSGEIGFDVDILQDFYELSMDVRVSAFNLSNFLIDEQDLRVDLAGERLRLDYKARRGGADLAVFKADLPYRPGDPLEFEDDFYREPVFAQMRLNPTDLSREAALLALLGLDDITGILNASMDLSGTAEDPVFNGTVNFRNGRVSGVPVDSLRLVWNYNERDQWIDTRAVMISAGQQAASFNGRVPFAIDWRSLEVVESKNRNSLELIFQSDRFDLAALNQFVDRNQVRNITGNLSADLRVTGNFDEPLVVGEMRLRNGSLFAVENNNTFRTIESDVRFSRDAIAIERLSVTSSGTFTGSGRIGLLNFAPHSLDLNMSARNFRVSNSRDLQAFVSLNTRLAGTVEQPRLTGSFNLERGFIYLDNFGESSVEEVILDDEEPSRLQQSDLWNNLAIEMKISSNRNFLVRNRSRPEIYLHLTGELDVVKYKGEEIQLFGNMGANEGYVTQLGKRFNVERGNMRFSGPVDNPALDVRALYTVRQPSDVKIWYVITGTLEEPEFRYESEPEMELQDIVSYTVFGRPFYALMTWEQTVAGRTDALVADAVIDILLDRVEQLASERLGLDVIEIDHSRSSFNPETRIRAGKYLSDRVFVGILQEFGYEGASQVMIEYRLRKNLDLIISGSDNYQTGVDLLWKFDY